jgi:trigger factor
MQEKIKVCEISKTEYKILINIPAEEVDRKFDEFFESIKDQVQIPGFRKGKAPISRLKSMFTEHARAPVSQSLIGEYYSKMLQENDINPVGSPVFKNLTKEAKYAGRFGFDNSFSVEMTVEVLPKLDPKGYENMELNIPALTSEHLTESKLLQYREQFAERSQISDRGAELGDTLVIDFVGYVDDKPFDGGTAKGHTLDKLGQANFIPGFEDQLVGVKSGEKKTISVKFPDQYRAEHLAGKDAKFEVEVHSIVETKLADVDEDLALMVGFESVEDMMKNINEDVEKEKMARDRQVADRQIIMKLLEENPFDAPKMMVEQEFKSLMSRVNAQDLPNNIVGELRKNAEYNVKRAIIIDSIYEKENNLEVSPDELNELLEQHAKANNKTKDELVSALYNSGQMDNFVGVLRTSKVIDFIINNSNKESEEENGRTENDNGSDNNTK